MLGYTLTLQYNLPEKLTLLPARNAPVVLSISVNYNSMYIVQCALLLVECREISYNTVCSSVLGYS